MPSPSCPSVIDQSHPQSANPHDNPLLANIPEPNSEEEEEEEEEYAARLYLAVTYGKETLDFFKDMHSFWIQHVSCSWLLGWLWSDSQGNRLGGS